MKILFLTQTCESGPSSRYRVYQLLKLLLSKGFHCEVSPGIDEKLYQAIYVKRSLSKTKVLRAIWKRRCEDLNRIKDFDLIFIQKGVFPGLYSGFEKKIARKKPVIFDFDDALWLPRPGGNFLRNYFHRKKSFDEIIKVSSAVIAGNSFLADYASRYNRNITVIPTSLDFSKYSVVLPSSVVGWIGSRSTLPYLKNLKNVIQKLNLIPRVIGAGPIEDLGFKPDFRPWNLDTELNELRQIGIGISPLLDTAWEQGKCGVKVLQYMACGIPVVASPVGVQKQMIQHGKNGYLAKDENDWIRYLEHLLQDEPLRGDMGKDGRKYVEENYNIQNAAANLSDVFNKVI